MITRKNIKPLRQNIMLKLNILIICVVSIISFVSYQSTSKIMLEDSILHTQQLLSNTIYNGEQFLENINSFCSQILYDGKVLEILQRDNNTNKKNYGDLLYVSEKLRTILLVNSHLSAAGFYKDKFYIHDNTLGEISEALEGIKGNIHKYAKIGKGKPVFVRFPRLENYIGITRMIYNKDFTGESSIIVVFISVENFKTVIKPELREYKDYGGLFDLNTNTSMFQPEIDVNGDIPPLILNQMKSESYGSYTVNETSSLVSYRSFSKLNWTLYLKIPTEEIYKRTNSLKLTYILLGLISILISSILGSIIASGIAKPLQELVLGIKKMENEPQIIKLKVHKNDEIGYLSSSFNKMSIRLDNLVNKVYQEEIIRKDVELKALQAQINPHFLFNVLESISWMARLKGADDASKMINALSDILHVRMGKSSSSLIPLANELDYLKNYIFLQQFRFEDNLIFNMDIDKRLLNFSVPSLILQPLVENSIHHNNPSDKALTILVAAGFSEESICLNVIDNGEGMEESELLDLRKSIKRSINNENDINKDIIGKIGVENVARRIFLLFGKDSSLEVFSTPLIETKIRIRIPLEKLLEQEEKHV